MRTHSPLVLDVHELLEHHGVQRPVAFDAPVPDMRVGLAELSSLVHFDLILEAIDGGVVVRGTLSGEYTAECRRCLKPLTHRFEQTGSEVFRPAGDAWEEGYVVKDTTVDLEPMARDMIALNMEGSPLCRPDCAGLCSRCGADLNVGQCGCVDEEVDTRWSALKELGRDLNR